MNVFISWSGETSKAFALAVNNWLKQGLHKVKPWMSDAEIGPGERWGERLSSVLKDTDFGIICVTPGNLSAPWVLFEAGALAKAVDSARVVPLLFGVRNTDLVSPLAQFQAVQADEEGFLKLAAALNRELKKKDDHLDDSILLNLLRKLWPELEGDLKRVPQASSDSATQVHRSERELLGDVLEGVRRLERTVVSGSGLKDSAEPGSADWQDYYIRGANLANNLGDPAADVAALRAYSEAIVLAPRDLNPNLQARLYAHRGAALKRLRRINEAENDLSFALRCASKEQEINDATYHMASVRAMQGDRQKALGLLEELVSRDSRWLDLVESRGEYFPGLLHDAGFRELVRLRLGKGPRKRAHPSAVSNVPGPPDQMSSRGDAGREAELPVEMVFGPKNPPSIACINQARCPLGMSFDALIAAMQIYIDQHVAPVWGTPAKLIKATGFQPGAWAMVFLDNADQAGALAYHDLTPEGLAQAKVFVRGTLDSNELVSVGASHQLVEMLVDPANNRTVAGPDPGVFYAYESADPVEELSFVVNGVPMSDFVYPAYFETFHKPGSAQFDFLNKVTKPFQILPGGYQIIFTKGKWSQVYGSTEKKKSFAREDRRGHRSEQRAHTPIRSRVA